VTNVRDLLRFPGGTCDLSKIDSSATPGPSKSKIRAAIAPDTALLESWQERLTAEKKRSVLLVLQGMDTSGKDGTVKHVIGAVDPQGIRLTAFKEPTDEEKAHDFLWRIRNALPRPGEIGVFNRSQYEDVLVVRVHQLVEEEVWRARYDEINDFEAEVAAGGTTIVKVFLHISRNEQARRLIARLDDPTKQWKFNDHDIAERGRWDDYTRAYEDVISECSTEVAPWYIVPADKKWYRNWAIARLLIETLEALRPEYPHPDLDVKALKARLG